MAKNLKINIKNTQLAKVAGLDKLKAKLAGKEQPEVKEKESKQPKGSESAPEEQKPPRIRAKSKSSFAKEEVTESKITSEAEEIEVTLPSEPLAPIEEIVPEVQVLPETAPTPSPTHVEEPRAQVEEPVKTETPRVATPSPREAPTQAPSQGGKLGPTGRHINDLLPRKKEVAAEKELKTPPPAKPPAPKTQEGEKAGEEEGKKDLKKGKKVKEFKDLKPLKKEREKSFDARDRHGLSEGEEERWRKKRAAKGDLPPVAKSRSSGRQNSKSGFRS